MKKILSVLSLSVLSIGLIGCDDSALKSFRGGYACTESYDIVKALVDNTSSYNWSSDIISIDEEVELDTDGDTYVTSCRTEFELDGYQYEQLVRIEEDDENFLIYPADPTEL